MKAPTCGYYDAPGKTEPDWDPGLDIDCPVCERPLSDNPTVTINVRRLDQKPYMSWFYRLHKGCHATLSERECMEMDELAMGPGPLAKP